MGVETGRSFSTATVAVRAPVLSSPGRALNIIPRIEGFRIVAPVSPARPIFSAKTTARITSVDKSRFSLDTHQAGKNINILKTTKPLVVAEKVDRARFTNLSPEARYRGNLNHTVKLTAPTVEPSMDQREKVGRREKSATTQPEAGKTPDPTIKQSRQTYQEKALSQVLETVKTKSRVVKIDKVFTKEIVKAQVKRLVENRATLAVISEVISTKSPEVTWVLSKEVKVPSQIIEPPKVVDEVRPQPLTNPERVKVDQQTESAVRVVMALKELNKLDDLLKGSLVKAGTEARAVSQVQTQVDQAVAAYQALVKAGVKTDQAKKVITEALEVSTASKPKVEVLTRTFNKALENPVKIQQLVDQKKQEEEEKQPDLEIFLNVDEAAYEVRSEAIKLAIVEAFKKARAEGRTTVSGFEIVSYLPKEPTRLKIRSQVLGQFSIFKWIFDGSWSEVRAGVNSLGSFSSEEEALRASWSIHNNNRPVEVDFKQKKPATEQEYQKVVGGKVDQVESYLKSV